MQRICLLIIALSCALCPTSCAICFFPVTDVVQLSDNTYHIVSSGHDASVSLGEARSKAYQKANSVCPTGYEIMTSEERHTGRQISVEIVIRCNG